MRLGTKTFLVTGIVMAALIAGIVAVSVGVVRGGFSQLESTYAQRNIDRVRMALGDRQEALATALADWTTWDAMYRYAADRDALFAEENLKPDSLAMLDVAFVHIRDAAGSTVWSGMLGSDGKTLSPVPESAVALVAADGPLVPQGPSADARTGIFVCEGRPMIVAARAILTSTNDGPSHGVMLMGRSLGAQETAEISSSLRLDVAFDTKVTDVPRKVVTPDMLVLGGTVDDVYARPALAFRVQMPRDIYANGMKTVRLFAMLSSAAGIVLIVTVIFLLHKMVLTRIGRLSREIGALAASKDFSARVTAVGADELTGLARDVNELLDCVVASRRELAHAHQEMEDLSQELRRMERLQFQAVLDEMGDAVIVCDGTWVIRELNDAAASMLQLSKSAKLDIVKYLYAHFDVSVPRDALVSQESAYLKFDVVRRATDHAKALYLETVLDVIKGPSGAVMRRLLVLRDVSDARRNEIMKQDFLGLVSHKLRTPVTVLSENADMLGDPAVGGTLTPAQRDMLGEIDGQVRALKTLIEKLLAFTEASSAHQTMLADTIALQSYLLGRAQKLYDVGRAIEICVDCPDRALSLTTSRMSLDLIVDNLIENAVKFGDKDPTLIVLSALRTDRGIELSVADNGPGIPPEDSEAVFSMFHQVEKGFTGQVAGVGLGLALVKKLVEACAGTVEMRSDLGKGTRFTMVFPAA